MNHKTAESLLPCYRADRKGDARLVKAAQVAERDQSLRRRLHEQSAFDERVLTAVRAIEPPADFGAQLGAARAQRSGTGQGMRKWLNSAGLAVAAGVLLIAGFIVHLQMENRADFPGKGAVEGLLELCSRMDGSELEAKKTPTPAGQLGDALYMAGFEGFALPPDFAAIPTVGWRVFRLQGHRVAQLAIDHSNALVFVFRATDFGVQAGAGHEWRLVQREEWAGAVKEQDGMCTLVAIHGDKRQVEDFLKSLAP